MADTYKKKEYTESDSVKNLQAEYQKQAASKPAAYSSQWQSQIDNILGQIQNRQPFTYDADADALYQNYKNNYSQMGKQAMEDTMGQAAALTGGYGNSYAQSVGQQTYNGYMQQLTDKIPALYQLALDKYNAEGDALYKQYGLLTDREGQDYSRYQDSVAQHNADLDRLYGMWQSERDYDYGLYMDDQNFQYQMNRDAVADQQWQKSFDESKRQYDQEWAYQQMKDGKLTALEAAELMASVGDYSLLAQYYGLTDEQLKKLTGEGDGVYYDLGSPEDTGGDGSPIPDASFNGVLDGLLNLSPEFLDRLDGIVAEDDEKKTTGGVNKKPMPVAFGTGLTRR